MKHTRALLPLLLLACSSEEDAASTSRRSSRSADETAISASKETTAETGVAEWGVSGSAADSVVRGYDTKGKKVVEIHQTAAHGEGAYHVATSMTGGAKATMSTEVEDSAASNVAVGENSFASNAKARRYLDHLAKDSEKKSEAPGATGGGGISLTKSLRPQGGTGLTGGGAESLIACVQALLSAVQTALTAAQSCSLTGSGGQAPQQCISGVSSVVDGLKSAGGSCGGGGGGGGGDQSGGGQGSNNNSGTDPDTTSPTNPTNPTNPTTPTTPTTPAKPDACTQNDSKYTLPVQGKAAVALGNDGELSHNTEYSRYAYDFALPRGATLTAMADGTVAKVSMATQKGSPCYEGGGIECIDKANYVIIHHADGRDSLYMHLEASDLKLNQAVKRGDVIGKVGSTGHSTGPHAHVQLQEPCAETMCRAVPLEFGDVANGVPRSGETVTSCR